ncbi:MAG: glucose-1-phosphate adenylyltransferase [Planctomycetota bacterium]|nr:MAG: glucose-1-phosphate adenylyltransferase [Planctomycetota bacterium]
MKNVIALVLGGGRGTRLYPLTKVRSKPAVPIGGKYRLIDVPLSNCINSGVKRVYVLTQFNSVSLHRHIRATYNFDPFSRGFVEILAAQQTLTRADWYQGTADAVRQNLNYLKRPDVDYVLILSGDQLYRMDFREMIDTHQKAGADVTIASVPVTSDVASALGIMRVDESGKVVGFCEKPQTQEALDSVRVDPAWIDRHGIDSRGRDCLASMGIYLFNREVLVDLLEKTDYQDFGKEVFPSSIESHHVQLHLFDGYWEDIGTIRAFYEANLSLARPNGPFSLGTPDAPLYTRPRFLPPSRFDRATVRDSLIADGCIIADGAVVENSVIGLRCFIGPNSVIRNSIVMGADYFETTERPQTLELGAPPVGIGANCLIENAIVDKNCRIGADVRISNTKGITDSEECETHMIRDGIIVVPKDTILPDGWAL